MTTWYLKYRPQKVSDLNSTSARSGLEKIIASGKVPQSLLFTGPKGIGKTSAARIVAKVLNCQRNKGKTREPCNECDHCKAITEGNFLDVLEIDGASNRGIDDVRELRERVRLAPTAGQFRVYIIDEVHMLTTEAFNALLKTLEEPPAHAVFILCTTDPQKLPETIVSRCTRIVFKHATVAEELEKLEMVAKAEKLNVEKGGLELLAEAAKGSFRDGVKLLEQAAGGAKDGKVPLSDIRVLVEGAAGVEPMRLLEALAKHDELGAVKEINRVALSGASLRVYTESLVETLRAILIAQVGVSVKDEEKVTNETLTGLSTSDLDDLIRLLSRAYLELKDAVVPQLPLELAAVEWCTKGETAAGTRKLAEEHQTEVVGRPSSPSVKALVKTIETVMSTGSADHEVGKVAEKETDVVVKIGSVPPGVAVSFDQVNGSWEEVMKRVKPKNYSVEALLRSCKPVSVEEGSLLVEVFYKFHKDRLESDRYRRIVEDVVAEVVGVPLKLKFRLGEKIVQKVAIDQTAPVPVENVNGATVEDDIVNAAAEIFKGAVVE